MARESQGLQIALIIFVLLTVMLGVSTYYGFNQFDQAQLKARAAEADKLKTDQDLKRAQDEANELKRLIGFADTEKLDAISQAATQDMEVYAKTYPEPSKPYRKVLEYLAGQLKTRTEELAASKADDEVLKRKYEGREAAKEPQLVVFQKAATKASEDLLAQAGKFANDTAEIHKDKAALAAQLADARKQGDSDRKKLEAQLAKAVRQIQNYLTEVKTVNTENQKLTRTSFTAPTGAITRVNQAQGVVWISLGSADQLNLQTNFAVYSSDSSSMEKAVKKGSIEVIQIEGDHLAQARITNDKMNDPILPGDKIFTPIWSPGEQKHFAIAGFIDIDGDGRSDLDYVKNLITMNGGKVDAVADDQGNLVGGITTSTRYLIMGAPPTETAKDSKLLKTFSKLVGEADRLNIQKIDAKTLLQMMGNPSQPKVIHYGQGANEKDFRPAPADASQPVSRGSVTDLFKPRRPAASTSSAY
jgi:hypothetical protein